MRSGMFMTLHKADGDSPMEVSLAMDVGNAFIFPFDARYGALFVRPDDGFIGNFTGCVRGIDNVVFGYAYKFKNIVALEQANVPIIRPNSVLIDAERNPSLRLQALRKIHQREIQWYGKLKYKDGFWKGIVTALFPMLLLCMLCLCLYLLA